METITRKTGILKKHLLLMLVLLLSGITSFGQMHLDKPIDLNSSTPSNARIMGIKQVSAAQDAVSAEVLQSGSLIYATSAGTSSDYTLTLAPVLGSYTTGMEIRFKAHTPNAAGPVTLDVNTLGAKPIKKDVGTNLAAGDIQTGQLVTVAYDGTNFQLLSRTSDANSGGTVTAVTAGTGLTGGTINTTGTIGLSTPVAVTNGGTGTGTQFNAGSVVFAGTGGVYAQDITAGGQLFWNATNHRLGIGTAAPAAALEINGQLKMTGGSPGVNKVLTSSDATGLATWVTPTDNLPSGAVMFFNLAACPAGWSDLVAAQGRYIVGLPTAGTLAGTSGTPLTNLESRPVGQHNHTFTGNALPNHVHGPEGYPFVGATGGSGCLNNGGGFNISINGNTGAASAGTPSGTISNSGAVAGTNAPYIQLRICQKN